MDSRYSLHPDHAKQLDSAGLRSHFHVPPIFEPGNISMTYTHEDRVIILGICPGADALELPDDTTVITGTDFMLQRRELGLINVGGPGTVSVDGEVFSLDNQEGLYVGMGAKQVEFASDDAAAPAKFYANSAPAHHAFPHKHVTIEESSPVTLGAAETNNQRTIYRYLHPDVMPTCQLLMGLTKLGTGSNWNTFPPHTHDRRMETYFYFDMSPDTLVFHFMGKPDETRHLVMRNEEVAISPPWSIHCGAGTGRYSFIWCMAGENQVFEDMDMIAPEQIR